MRFCTQILRRSCCLVVVCLLLLGAGLPAGALDPGDDLPQTWRVRDRDGQLWGLTLLPVGDAPASEAGAGQDWRLRLTARSAGLRPDHQEPLTLADAQGQVWTLANSSGELVTGASQPLPASAAQFRGKPLRPAPREAWPLELRIPLEDGAGQPLAPARVTLGPEAAAELQRLGRGGP